MRSFRPDSGLTTLRPTAQAIAIEINISTAMTIEGRLRHRPEGVVDLDMYSAEPIIRFHGAKPRVKATLSSGVGSLPLRRNA